MIPRIRSEHDIHWLRNPAGGALSTATTPSEPSYDEEPADQLDPEVVPNELYEEPVDESEPGRPPPARRSAGHRLLLLVVLGAAGYLGLGALNRQSNANPVPATPRAWLADYEAAAITNPGRVCSQLLSPGLAAAYAAHAGTCTAYFKRIRASSVTVRRVLTQGPTAVLELHQTVDHLDWAVVLTHQGSGWQALDIVDGPAAH